MTNAFQTAVANKDWDAVDLLVRNELHEDVSRDGLRDWLEEGAWTGNETPMSVANEWAELNQQEDGIDY